MTQVSLHGCRILVVEDEYVLAEDLCTELLDRHATVIGPAATVDQGFQLLRSTEDLHGAVLDINLRGEEVFGLADALTARGVPIVLTTGYDASVIPERFRSVPRCEKPVRMSRVIDAIGRAAHA